VGQRVLAVDDSRNTIFAEVVALPHSPSAENFMMITMVPSLSSTASFKHGLQATLHHTFPKCGGDEAIRAMDLKPGDCLHTVTGKGVVQSAVLVPVTTGDVTYTIELKGADLVAVGGVFTHAKGMTTHAPLSVVEEKVAHSAATSLKKAEVKFALKKGQLLAVNHRFKLEHKEAVVSDAASKVHPSLRNGQKA